MLTNITCRSSVLDQDITFNVLLPEPRALKIWKGQKPVDRDMQVLYLLHGYKGGPSEWQRKTSVERYMHEAECEMLIVIPGMYNFFYTDMYNGLPWFEFISEELPSIVKGMFHVSEKREDTFVAGLSMGGYGALKLAMTHPERYGFAASFSGGVDPIMGSDPAEIKDEKMRVMIEQLQKELTWLFGPEDKRRGSENDLYALLEKCDPKTMPKIYQSCGESDSLFGANVALRDAMIKRGLDVTWYQQPDTAHEWRFWDSEVKKLIDMLPEKA